MKKDLGKPYKLGIFVTTAFAVLLVATYLIGQKQHLFGKAFRISGTFNDVGGLQVGNNVRFAGVNVGSVESITITGNNAVKVGLLISEDAHQFIKKDSVAGVGSESMMGNKVVVLAPGTEDSPQVMNNDMISTAIAVTIDDILKQVKHTSDNAVVITSNLAKLSSTIHAGKGAIGKIFEDETFANDLSKTLANFKDGSAGLKELVTGARKSWLFWGAGKTQAEKNSDEKEKAEKKKMEQPTKEIHVAQPAL